MVFWKRKRAAAPARTLWLVKDDPEGSWWCNCPQGIVDAPMHDKQTWPTGGEGWLFTCIRCEKAFMFAKAVRIRPTLEELAERCTPRTEDVGSPDSLELRTDVLMAGPQDWLAVVRPHANGLVEGQRYVFFDGRVLPAVHGPVKFRGLWRNHDLPDLPHIAEDPGVHDVLNDPRYWAAEMGE